MAAEALEKSVLDSKDKEQLLAIAQALGIKTSARAAKATLIDKILESTRATAAPARPAAPSPAPPTAAAAPPAAPATPVPAEAVAVPASVAPDAPVQDRAATTPQPAEVSAGSEPLADWEADLDREVARSASGEPSNARSNARSNGDVGAAHGASAEDEDGDDGDADGEGDDAGAGEGESRGSRRRRRRRKGRGAELEPGAPARPDVVDRPSAPAPAARPPQRDDHPENFPLDPVQVAGYLDLRDEGYGFLRVNGYLPSRDDSYVPVKLTRQFGLRKGDHLVGLSRPAGRNEKNPAMLEIHTINGADPELARSRPRFEELTAVHPDTKLTLEDPSDPEATTGRVIDLVAPIGRGQRGLVVAPPRSGTTTIVTSIAASIERNHPDVTLIVLLVDARPEEVTDMRRTVRGEVVASTFDRPSEEHAHVAELAIEKAKRLVERGQHVVILLDGITALGRAYNLAAPATGRTLASGMDAAALHPPKRFFGAARNVEEGGSLTVVATALVDTNSRIDEAILEELQRTANMELRLDRELVERGVFPAIDIVASRTRHDERLVDGQQHELVAQLRRRVRADGGAASGVERLLERVRSSRTNAELVADADDHS